MKLYVVRHGEAKPEEQDQERSLTKKGKEDVEKMAGYAGKNLNLHVRRIYHSRELRTRQTAEAFTFCLNGNGGIDEAEGLDPLDDPKIWVDMLEKETEDVMIVGHLPFLLILIKRLLGRDKGHSIHEIPMASIVGLVKDEKGGWNFLWKISPEDVS